MTSANRRPRHGEPAITRIDDSVVGGCTGEESGAVTTVGTTEQMLAGLGEMSTATQTAKQEEQEMTTKRVKSIRYADVPTYTIEDLDMDSVRDVFVPLDFTDSERQIAGALVNNPDATDKEVAKILGGKGTTPIRRVRKILEGDTNPTEKQKKVLRFARENPNLNAYEVGRSIETSGSYVKYLLRAYRTSRVEITVPVEHEETGVDEEVEETPTDDTEETTTVESDLAASQTPRYAWEDEMEAMAEQVEALEDRLNANENRWTAVRSLTDRALNNMASLERFVEEKLGNEEDAVTQEDLERLKEDVNDAYDRLGAIETSLKTHKDAITTLKESGVGDDESLKLDDAFSTEEKRELIKSVAKNGDDDLLDVLLDRL